MVSMMARLHRWQSGKGGSNAAHHHEHKGLRDCSLDVKEVDSEEYASNPIIFVVLADGIVCSKTPPTWSMSKEKVKNTKKFAPICDVFR